MLAWSRAIPANSPGNWMLRRFLGVSEAKYRHRGHERDLAARGIHSQAGIRTKTLESSLIGGAACCSELCLSAQ